MRKIRHAIGLMILALSACSGVDTTAIRSDAPPPSSNARTEAPSVVGGSPSATSAASPIPVETPTSTASWRPSADPTSHQPAPGPSGVIPLAGSEIVVNQSLVQMTIDCADRSVIVNGSMNQITYTGSCVDALMNGSLNHVSFERVASITINGARNEVTWREPGYSGPPQVRDHGFGNRVGQG